MIRSFLRRSAKRYRDQALVVGTMMGLAAVLAVGCSGSDHPGSLEDSSGPIGLAQGPCEMGQERVCGVTLEQEGDSVTCYRGVQVCEAGTWSGCTNGRLTKEPLPDFESARFKTLSLSVPAACGATNACDPGCMYFNEDPNPDVTPPGGTGMGMGGVPNWSSPPSSATCAHGLCEVGVALDPTCIPCAATVCATDPSCCTGTGSTDDWDNNCIALVYSDCAAAPPPPNICDYAAFGENSVRLGNGSTGFPTIGSNGTVTPEPPAALGNIFAKGKVDIRNSNTINGNIVTEGEVWFESPSTISGDITARLKVDIRDNAVIGGSITAGGNVNFAANSTVNGDIWSGAIIDLSSNATVAGSTRSVGNLTGQAGADVLMNATVHPPSTIDTDVTIGGTASTAGPVTAPPTVTVDLPTVAAYERDLASSCAVAATRPSFSTTSNFTAAPGIYGNITIHSGYDLVLASGGSYIFNSLTWYSNGGVTLQGTGPWDISVCGAYRTDTNMTVYLDGTSTPPDPTDYIVYSDAASGDCISIGDTNVFNGMMLAPKCTIRVFNGSTATAALWGKEVYTNYNFNLFNIPQADCEEVPVGGNTTCGSTALYTDGAVYAVGAQAHYENNIYECTNAFCSVGGGYGGTAGYWPGEGLDWATTWTLVSPCPSDPSPNECPVTVDLPGTPGPYEPCYSGLECQVNSRCTEVLSGATCAHHKCAEGPPLAAACDTCVDRICDIDSTCCSTGWDSVCVGMVESVCDAECGAPTALGCDHDACDVGGALDATCSTDVADVCATPGFAYCCDTGTPDVWDQACIDQLYIIETGSPGSAPAPGQTICDYAVMGRGSGSLHGTTVVGNLGWFAGSIDMNPAGGPVSMVTGDFYQMNGSVSVTSTSIGGDMVVNGASSAVTSSNILGNLELPNPSMNAFNTVSGTTYSPPVTTLTAPTVPTFAMTCPTGGADNWSASGTIAPGTYGILQLGGNITLQPGDYYFQQFNNWGTHNVTLPAGGGDVNIYVCWDFNMNGGNITSPTADPLQLHVYSANGVVRLAGGGTHYGVYHSGTSSGTIVLGMNTKLYGMLHGYHSVVQTEQGSRIDSGGYTRDDCLARGVDPTVSVTPCPVTTPTTDTIGESGTCVDNGTMHQVASGICPDVDLAVDIACDDDVVVCNHGNTDVPANEAELVFYPQGGLQFATETPNPGWEVGRCTVTTPINAGECVTQACDPTLVDQDLTIRAALTSGASVTECSTLDNWSYYVDAYSCSGGAAMPLQIVEDYEAVCPDDSYPSWGLLTWRSDTPGLSNITFEGRTSFNGVFGGAYTALGTADAASMTSDCLVGSSALGCPVDLYGEFFPSPVTNEPTHMQLRITLNPSGMDEPTLEDWRVTYTCREDQ